MTIDAAQLRTAVQAIHPGKLAAEDAETVIALAQMAVDADGQEDAEEIKLFFAFGKAVNELAGIAESPTPTFADDDDDDRLGTLAGRLATREGRELAYAIAHVLSIVDVEISPAEDDLLTGLRQALGLPDERADELAAQLSAAITPMD